MRFLQTAAPGSPLSLVVLRALSAALAQPPASPAAGPHLHIMLGVLQPPLTPHKKLHAKPCPLSEDCTDQHFYPSRTKPTPQFTPGPLGLHIPSESQIREQPRACCLLPTACGRDTGMTQAQRSARLGCSGSASLGNSQLPSWGKAPRANGAVMGHECAKTCG